MADLILPWRLYGLGNAVPRARRHFRDREPAIVPRFGDGTMASFSFPARRLAEWRRMRDLALCLIEATAVSIHEVTYPSRNAALCAEIKQSLAEHRNSLVR